MTAAETLIEMVRSMRTAQKAYFRDRRPEDLQAARDWERRVDQALLPQSGKLFEEGGG